jgi:hypothetical protein
LSVELNEEQLSLFQENGFLLIPDVFSPGEIQSMRAESGRLLEFLINSSLANGRTSGRLDLRETPRGSKVVRKIQPVVDLSPCFRAVASDHRVIGPVRQIQDAEPELMEEKFSYKQVLPTLPRGLTTTKAEAKFLLHNDHAYHLAHGYPATIVTCGILVDDSPAESGPLRVWPGSHRQNFVHESVNEKSYQVPAAAIDPESGVDIVARAGSVIFFSDLLLHNSGPNLTSQPRRLLFFSYTPRGSVADPDMRNRPFRAAEAPFEQNYREAKLRNGFVDTFQAPVD